MGAVSIRDLNSNISRIIARVEAGETLDVTRNGRVVAEIRPKRPVRDAAWWKNYHEMVAAMKRGLPIGAERITEDDKYGDADL
jgi:antitoxin (DNA-binding transcriptional repressor) of toxin-antitoxin stability system